MSLVNIASQYYRTTISIFLFIILSGSLVFNNIPKESSPDVSLPYIYVSLGLTGISPEDSEKLLIKPVEDEISNIEGKKEMTSTSYQSGGNVLLEFNAGFDGDNQYIGVKTPLDNITMSTDNGSPNPMDANWKGHKFTQEAIDNGDFTGRTRNILDQVDDPATYMK